MLGAQGSQGWGRLPRPPFWMECHTLWLKRYNLNVPRLMRDILIVVQIADAVVLSNPVSRTGIFTLFLPYFLDAYALYFFKFLSYQATYIHSEPVMDMVIFRTIFFELLVFFTFTFLTLYFAC